VPKERIFRRFIFERYAKMMEEKISMMLKSSFILFLLLLILLILES
jgi:hypothetical protein